jgi:hypothetical protein
MSDEDSDKYEEKVDIDRFSADENSSEDEQKAGVSSSSSNGHPPLSYNGLVVDQMFNVFGIVCLFLSVAVLRVNVFHPHSPGCLQSKAQAGSR